MKAKKWFSALLAAAVMCSLIPAAVSAEESKNPEGPEGWVSGGGYGSISQNTDGTYTFKGDDELNSDNSHCGPYTKAEAGSFAEGDIEDSVHVFIDPAAMEVGEKFTVTVSLNDTSGEYKTELAVNFWKGNHDSVEAAAGMAPGFSGDLKETGVYTLKYRFYDDKGSVYARFAIELNGKTVAEANGVDMKVKTAECSGRGYVWFCDISVEGGLRVGMPGIPSPAPQVQKAPVLLPADWVTGEGYGSKEVKSDNETVLTGDPELNSDNSHSGPYVNAKGGLLADGTVVDEVNVYLDPAQMDVGEKFALTSSLNNKESVYLTELLANFQKGYNDSIEVAVGLDPAFSAEITEAGLYTLRYTYIPGETMVFGVFSIWKDGEEIASTSNILMPGASVEAALGRRAVWFSDISVEGGLTVYSVAAADYSRVDEALSKIPDDLSLYTDETVKALEAAMDAVVRGKNVLEQDTVDGYAEAIEKAAAALTYKGADYSRVDEAIAKAEALDRDSYTDFSAVDAAVKAVIRGKNITEQAEVDAMAKAIEDAVAALEKAGGASSAPDPSDPSDPSGDASSGTSSGSESGEDVPTTGEAGNPAPWVFLMVLAGSGAAGTALYVRKRRAQ